MTFAHLLWKLKVADPSVAGKANALAKRSFRMTRALFSGAKKKETVILSAGSVLCDRSRRMSGAWKVFDPSAPCLPGGRHFAQDRPRSQKSFTALSLTLFLFKGEG